MIQHGIEMLAHSLRGLSVCRKSAPPLKLMTHGLASRWPAAATSANDLSASKLESQAASMRSWH